MIIRKTTKIELKPEDDYHEYEEFKQQQTKKNQINKAEMYDYSPQNNKNPLKLNLLNEMFRNTNSNIKNSNFNNQSLIKPTLVWQCLQH
jgi:hypothetical protein